METEGKANKFIKLILDNVEDIVSILILITLLILDKIFSLVIEPEVYFYLLFGVLVTISIGNIRNKYAFFIRDNRLLTTLKGQLNEKLIEPVQAKNFFHKPPLFEEILPDSGEILISGISLVETIGKLQKKLDDAITNGAHVRIILLDENNTGCIEELIKRSWGKVDKEYYIKRINCTYTQIQVIADKIKGTQQGTGTLEVGRISFVPSFGIIASIPNDISKKMLNVKIYHHLTNNAEPNFSLEYCKDQEWFDFFVDQFNKQWEISKPVKLL